MQFLKIRFCCKATLSARNRKHLKKGKKKKKEIFCQNGSGRSAAIFLIPSCCQDNQPLHFRCPEKKRPRLDGKPHLDPSLQVMLVLGGQRSREGAGEL